MPRKLERKLERDHFLKGYMYELQLIPISRHSLCLLNQDCPDSTEEEPFDSTLIPIFFPKLVLPKNAVESLGPSRTIHIIACRALNEVMIRTSLSLLLSPWPGE